MHLRRDILFSAFHMVVSSMLVISAFIIFFLLETQPM